ncbi:hypothetical protein [Nannocystis sp. SCPEA4]|uniref:hypothetical protein n=1 Tax=Nannocystis sp. SCPEA4 TaxID=2996787 RepID=UPI00227194B8|nr:hypothetical protein [Nannocystis sp. SCPEA4]
MCRRHPARWGHARGRRAALTSSRSCDAIEFAAVVALDIFAEGTAVARIRELACAIETARASTPGADLLHRRTLDMLFQHRGSGNYRESPVS